MNSKHQSSPKVVKLPSKVKDRLDQLGKLKHRSTHWLMKEAIVRYLEQEEYNERLKEETLSRWQEVENGKVLDHSVVSKWLDTWGK
jgi:predicted transcriptional regulator